MFESVTTGEKHKEHLWKPGQSGNPAGRPKGARNKLCEDFVQALHDDFKEHGIAAIQEARTKDPMGYVKVCAGLLPKELKIERADELTDSELDERIRTLASIIGLEIGVPIPSGGEEAQSRH